MDETRYNNTQSRLLMDVFSEGCTLVYTGCEYNLRYGQPHWKSYTLEVLYIGSPIYSHQEFLCASIRDVRLAPKLNVGLNDEILLSILTNYISL